MIVCYAWLRCSLVFPGVAIGFLALAAAIMAVRAEAFTDVERGIWILICGALFVVEITTIYKDRRDYSAEQSRVHAVEDENRRKEREAFARLLDEAESTAMKLKNIQRSAGQTAETTKQSLAHITEDEAVAKESASKRQEIRDKLADLLYMNHRIRLFCHAVGPPGSGGNSAPECERQYRSWSTEARDFIATLGGYAQQVFEDSKSDMTNVSIDGRVNEQIKYYMADLNGKANVLTDLVRDYK